MYDNSDKIKTDNKQAFKYYKLAAEAGHEDAQRRLAEMYEQGIGTKKDIRQAKYWLDLSTGDAEI